VNFVPGFWPGEAELRGQDVLVLSDLDPSFRLCSRTRNHPAAP
jgi:hypothetical protein